MKEKILVVDDEKVVLETLNRVLTKEDYIVTTTGDSHAALDMAKKEFFDLIILDVRMPDMDGISFLREIRETQREDEKSRVIIITGYASEDIPIKALKLGVDDYILKPFESDVFLNSVNRNIRLCQLGKEKKGYIEELKRSHEKHRNLMESLTNAMHSKTRTEGLEEDVRRILSGFEGCGKLEKEWKNLEEEWKKLDDKESQYKEKITIFKDDSEEITNDVSDETPKDVPGETQKDAPDDSSGDAPDDSPEDASGDASKDSP